MGIPSTSNLMPVIHIIPVNQATNQFVTVAEIKRKLKDAKFDVNIVSSVRGNLNVVGDPNEYYDLGSTFNFVRFNKVIEGSTWKVTLEFVDPTFWQFEKVLAAINREAYSSSICNIKFRIQIGWKASGIRNKSVVYPLQRDASLRAGKSLHLINHELVAEPFYVTVVRTNYAIQNTGIRYTMECAPISHTGEQLYSQSDQVQEDSQNLSYFTLFYYLASQMNILIYFDESVNFDQLVNGPHKWAFENKMNVDNMRRLLDTVNKGDEKSDKETMRQLQATISGKREDALNAMKQMLNTASKMIGAKEQQKQLLRERLPDIGKKIVSKTLGPNWLTSLVAAVGAVFNPIGTAVMGEITTVNTIKEEYNNFIDDQYNKEGPVAKLPENERQKALKYIQPLLDHYRKMSNYQSQDWKTYIISEIPSMMQDSDEDTVVYKSDSTFDMSGVRAKKFLGMYAHFAQDLHKQEGDEKLGIDSSVGMITSTNVSIDESFAFMNQQKMYSAIQERTGMIIDNSCNLLQKSQSFLGNFAKSFVSEKDRVSNSIKQFIGNRNPQDLDNPVIRQELYRNLNRPNLAPGLLPLAGADVITDELVNEQTVANNLAKVMDLPEGKNYTFDEITVNNDVIKELEEDNYFKKSTVIRDFNKFYEKKGREWTTGSLNPEDKRVKKIIQVARYQGLVELKYEQQRNASLNIIYNHEGILTTIKTIGDIGITPDLQGRAIAYVKFYNQAGSLNEWLTGFYILLGITHDISSTGIFYTELSLRGLSMKVIPRSLYNDKLDFEAAKIQSVTGVIPEFPTGRTGFESGQTTSVTDTFISATMGNVGQNIPIEQGQ
jgi:hypothetical protein